MAKISEMEPAEAGAELYRQYMSAHDAWVADSDVRHPSFDTKAWRQTARDAGTLRESATDEGGLGPVEIQNKRKGMDNPPGGQGQPQPPVRAQDGALSFDSAGIARFETVSGKVLTGKDAELAFARQSDPTRVKSMGAAIKGYNRL